MSDVTAPPRLTKQPGETLKMAMDFVNLLSSGESLATPTTVAFDSTTITASTGTISGTQVQFVVSGGTDGQAYRVQVTSVTSTSNTRQADGMLDVRDA